MTAKSSSRASPRDIKGLVSSFAPWTIPILCAALASLAFFPAVGAELVNLDDDWNLEFNPSFKGFSARHLAWMFTTSAPMGHYQPITWLTYAMDFELFGESYHRTNIFLHAAAAIAFYGFAVTLFGLVPGLGGRSVGGARGRIRLAAVVSTLVFAVHPLRVESVAWATGRNDLLSGMFILLSATSWVRYGGGTPCVRWKTADALSAICLAVAAFGLAVASIDLSTPGRLTLRAFGGLGGILALVCFVCLVLRNLRARGVRGPGQRFAYVAACCFLLLSFLCKSWAVSLPIVFIVLDLWPLGRLDRVHSPGARLPRPVAVLDLVLEKLPLLALCGVSAVIAGWAKSGTQTLIRTDQALVERTGQAFYGLAFYVLKTVWPSGLVVIRELPDDISLLAIRFLIPMSGVTSLAVLLWLARKRIPAATAAFASYGLIVAPALGLVQFNTQLVADRYSYVACMPLAILLGGAWVAAFDRLTHGRWVHGVIAVSVVAVLFVATWRQSAVWRTSESLYLHALKFGETSKVLANLALVYNEKALEGTSRRTQLLDEALSLSTRALDHARASGLQDPQYHLTLGTIRLNRGELDRAITEIQTCLEDRPDFLQARIHLGIAFMRAERFQEAVSCLQRAVQIAPENADAWMLLAMAFDGSGNRFNALQAYRRVVTIDPGNATALDRLRILENTR